MRPIPMILSWAAVLAPLPAAQVDSFDDLDWSLTLGTVSDDLLTLSMLGYFSQTGVAATEVPDTGRYEFTVTLSSAAQVPSFDYCGTTLLTGTVGCGNPFPTLSQEIEAGGFQASWSGTWSLWANAGDCLELRAKEDAFALACLTTATFADLVFRPPLAGAPAAVSVSAGGTQALALVAPPSLAGSFYWLLGTLSGVQPGLPSTAGTIPLNPDAYFFYTLSSPNQAPLAGSLGVLDAAAEGAAAFSLPPGTSPILVGLTLHHAFVVFTPDGTLRFVSGPAAVDLAP